MLSPTVSAALAWLAHSDIRCTGGDALAQGGVNRGYDWQARRYPYVYSEITGYAASLFVAAHRWTGDARYLALARQAGDFLLRVQARTPGSAVAGAIPQGLSLPDLQPMPMYYSFDAAMCLQGLLDLDAAQPDAALRESARAIGDWLLARMQQADGSFLAVYDAGADEWRHPGDEFPDDAGCLHAKHAIGLLKLGRAVGDARYTAAAQRVCDWVRTLQDPDGAFRANVRQAQVVSHPHCYAMEGLLYAHDVLGAEAYRVAAQRAGAWLLGAQNRDGSLRIAYKQRWWRMGRRITELVFPRRVTDATAQAIRVWLLLYYLSGDGRYVDASRRAAGFLRTMQVADSPDRNAAGAFYFWPGHPILFTWATMFAAHALYALENVDRENGYEQLIGELF